jgi:hypothetical protein
MLAGCPVYEATKPRVEDGVGGRTDGAGGSSGGGASGASGASGAGSTGGTSGAGSRGGTGGVGGAGSTGGTSGVGSAGGTGGRGGTSGAGSTGGTSGVGSTGGTSGVGSTGGVGGASGASGASGGGSAGAGSTVWRPFSDDSPWNTLIAEGAELEPDSAALIADLASSSPYGSRIDVNLEQFSVPMFLANASTPRALVRCRVGGFGFAGNDGIMTTAMVPMPTDALPDAASDHHLLIVDQATNTEWGLWNAAKNGAEWSCGTGASMDLSGNGVRPSAVGNRTWYTSHGPRACGFALSAGLITREAIEAGEIDHALVIAYPHIRAGLYTSPASTAQARKGDQSIQTRGIPCGGRVQLDPSVDVDSLGLSDAGRTIAIALQRYGAFVGDFSGGISVYAENSADAKADWQGVLNGSALAGLDLSDLRVLKLGTLYDNGNGN